VWHEARPRAVNWRCGAVMSIQSIKGRGNAVLNYLVALSQTKLIRIIMNVSLQMSFLVMISAVFTLILGLPLGTAGKHFLESSGLDQILSLIPILTSELYSFYFVFILGVNVGREWGRNDFKAGAAALICFSIFIIPEWGESSCFLLLEDAGGTGLTLAIFIGFLVAGLYVLGCSKRNNEV
jgi:Phosphotransferase system cellobiose-specific component IIC